MLNITSQKCYLPGCKTPFNVRSYCSEIIEVDELINIMAGGRTTLSKTDIEAVMRLLFEDVQDLVSKGYYVKTPIGNLYLNAKGTMNSEEENFEPNSANTDHKISLHYRSNSEFEDLCVKNAKFKRTEKITLNEPKIITVESPGKSLSNSLAAGSTIIIKGKRLSFVVDSVEDGVFLKNETDTVKCENYSVIKPSMIVAQIPESIKSGTYNISVYSSKLTKEIKESKHKEVISIA